MKDKISLSEAKLHFSEMVDEVAHKGRKKIITRRGKPVAVVAPFKKSSRPKPVKPRQVKKNLVEAVGDWRDDELYESIMKAYRISRSEMPRPVPKLDD
jgi:prevent-host-death family protein